VSGFTIPEIEPRPVQLQSALRAPARSATAWVPRCSSTSASCARRHQEADARARSPLGQVEVALHDQTIEALSKHLRPSTRTPAGRTCRSGRRRCSCVARATEEIVFRYDEGGRVYQVPPPLRGRHPQHGAALQGDRLAWSREEIEQYQNKPPVPGLRRLPAQARGAGGEDRRAPCGAGRADVDPAGLRTGCRPCPAAFRTRRTRSRAPSSRRSASGWASSTTWASNT
jgi:hypothetical protein